MRAVNILLFLAGLALVLGAALPQGGLALFTDSASIPGNTFTTAASFGCTAGDTGFLNPTAQAADTGGDGDGFELNPTNAFADGGGNATNNNGRGDRHRYYNYGISIDSTCVIQGIEVRLDWWLNSTSSTNSMSVELSWNGGTSWTAASTDGTETTTEHSTVLGASNDTWGRTWTPAELEDANFRVRVTSNSTSSFRDFYLDWVPVRVHYGAAGPPSVTILDAWTTGATHSVSSGADRLLLVSVYAEDTGVVASINTVTWGGQTLAEIGEATVTTNRSNLVWMGYLDEAGIAAASGSTIVATWSGTTPNNGVLYAAVTLENVDEITPIGGSDTGTSTSGATVQIASVLNVSAGDMAAYVTLTDHTTGTHTPDAGYTEGTLENGTNFSGSNATKVISSAGTEQPSATWSLADRRMAIVGAVINMAP